MKASLYCQLECTLGEGVIYDHRTEELLWLDIEQRHLYILNADASQLIKHQMPELIGFIALSTHGKYVVGLQTGIHYYNRDTASLEMIHDAKDYPDHNLRWNDGKCSPMGDIWAGTMRLDQKTLGIGALYRINKNLQTKQILNNVSISNGIAWHEDLHRMYYIDSPTRNIQVYQYDPSDSSELELLHTINIPKDMGYPDGMTIDLDGMLWVAHWEGSCVARWHPETGQLISKIDLPAPLVTCCSFGGKDRSRLFVTTARKGLSSEQLDKHPLSGSVFVIDTNTNGLDASIFGV